MIVGRVDLLHSETVEQYVLAAVRAYGSSTLKNMNANIVEPICSILNKQMKDMQNAAGAHLNKHQLLGR